MTNALGYFLALATYGLLVQLNVASHSQDTFGMDEPGWTLVFRGTAGINRSMLHTFLNTSGMAQPTADPGCLQINGSIPCSCHYRSSILDNWEDLPIMDVAFVIYEKGIKKHMVMLGADDSNFLSWFHKDRFLTSDWPQRDDHLRLYSIPGVARQRTFSIIKETLGACDDFFGWFIVVDGDKGSCAWEQVTSYPVFLYAKGQDAVHFQPNSPDVGQADVVAILVRYQPAGPR